MSQPELGKILGVSPETIKSLEAGRRRGGMPGREIVSSIRFNLGAQWNDQDEKWTSIFNGTEYTRAKYELYKKSTFDRPSEIHALCLRLISLLQRVPSKYFPSVSDTIEHWLLELANKYGIDWKADLREGNLVLSPIWKNGKETGDPADIVGYERSRTWIWDEAEGKWKKRNRGSKLLDFRDRLQKDESPKT